MADTEPTLGSRLAHGAAWSAMGTVVLRMGTFVVGIALARILTPEQFGAYAVALTVQSILITLADLGLSADLIRTDDPKRIAPTVASLALMSGAFMATITYLSSDLLANTLGSPEAAPAIAVLSITLLLAGFSVVPYAMLLRRFQQRELFLVLFLDFVVSTAVTLLLISLGWGVVGLAVGKVAGQIVSSTMQFVVAREVPKYSIDRAVVRPVLAFGLPVAGAALLMWGLLNVDYVVLARVAGATTLGYYVLAFNISNWPTSALSSAIKAISLPYFSRADDDPSALASLTSIAWAGALPIGAILAALSAPLIEVVYGPKWLPAAPALAALGLFGSIRVIFELFTGFLLARGRSRPVLWVQAIWLAALTVAMIFATQRYGIVGAGWVHVVVAVVVVMPCYAVALRSAGAGIVSLIRAAWWPTVATFPAVGVALAARSLMTSPVAELLVGGFGAVATYGLIMWPWLRRQIEVIRGQASKGVTQGES
ncbi:oligosaccharide flippase family protein [Gordonia sp. NPDC003424]